MTTAGNNGTLRIGPEYLFPDDRFVKYELSDRGWAEPLGIGESNAPLPIKIARFSSGRIDATVWNEPPLPSLVQFARSMTAVVFFDGRKSLEGCGFVQVDFTTGYPSLANIKVTWLYPPVTSIGVLNE